MASESIKNVGLYGGNLTDNIKLPIGNTGEDTAFTMNIGQIKSYLQNNIQLPYSSITNPPVIGDATITVYQEGNLAGKFTLNQRDDVTIHLNGGSGGGGGRAEWGYITGDIHSQQDLIDLLDDKLNGFAQVATSGSYNDLTDRPTIGNGSIVIRQGGVQKGNFTMNQTGDATIDLENNEQNVVSVAGSTVSLQVRRNAIYNCTGTVTDLKFVSVEDSQYESDIYFTTGSSCTFTYPNTLDGVVGATNLLPNKRYVIAIKDNRMVISYDGFDPSQLTATVVNNNPTLAYGQAATIGSVNGTNLTLTMPAAGSITVTDNNPTLSWGNQSTVATIGGTAIHVTMPQQPTFSQVNADWNATTGAAQILNKPTIPTLPSYTTETWTFTLSDNSTVTRTVYIVPAS